MKWLTERTEIAKAINIDRIPVITMDISKCMDGYEDCYEGSRISIDGAYSGRYADLLTHCTAMMFGDEDGNEAHFAPWTYKRIHLRPRMACLTADFSLRDVDEMVDWMRAPIVKKGEKVLVYFRGKDKGAIRVMRIPNHVDPHCSTACILEDVDE